MSHFILRAITQLVQWFSKPAQQVLGVSLLYYATLPFVNANIWLVSVTVLYCLVLLLVTRNWLLAFWTAFLVTLPIAKGKAMIFTLITKEELTARNAVFDVNFIFSWYIADMSLFLLLWVLTKYWKETWKQHRSNILRIYWRNWLLAGWIGCIISLVLPHLNMSLQTVHWLSVIIFIKLIIIFFIPLAITGLQQLNRLKKPLFPSLPTWNTTSAQAIVAVVLFQAFWSLLQLWHGGPVGKYLEAILPLGSNGEPIAIHATEDDTLLRTTGTFFDPSLQGTILFSLISWLWFWQPPTSQKTLRWLTLLAGTIALILTSNRILMVLLAVATLMALYRPTITYLHRHKSRLQTTSFWLLATVILVIGMLLFPYISNRFKTLSSAFDPYGSGTYRLQLGWYAIRLAIAQPWGVGLNLSPYYLATGFNQEAVSFDPSHPHNIWLQLLAEGGWLTTLLFALCIYGILRPEKQGNSLHWLVNSWGAAAIAFLLSAQFYPVFLNQPEVASWLFIFLGGYWAFRHQPSP